MALALCWLERASPQPRGFYPSMVLPGGLEAWGPLNVIGGAPNVPPGVWPLQWTDDDDITASGALNVTLGRLERLLRDLASSMERRRRHIRPLATPAVVSLLLTILLLTVIAAAVGVSVTFP